MKGKTFAATLAIILVVIGIGYVGNVFEVWHFRLFFPGWWTLFIIVPASVKLLMRGMKPIYLIWLGAGILLLVTRSEIIPEAVRGLTVPVVVIALGLTLFFRVQLGSGDGYIAIFGGRSPDCRGKPFIGCFALAIFGGVDIKIRESRIDRDVTIDAFAAFGGVDILVPLDGVNVEVSGLPIFGGIGEPKNRPHIEGAPTIRVNAVALFGGVDVK